MMASYQALNLHGKSSLFSPSIKSHIRLHAAIIYFKLVSTGNFDSNFHHDDWQLLSLLVQDPMYNVRDSLITKLCKYLSAERIPSHFAVFLALVAHDPENELKVRSKRFLSKFAASPGTLEGGFARFLYILAKHPDFTEDPDDIKLFERYRRVT